MNRLATYLIGKLKQSKALVAAIVAALLGTLALLIKALFTKPAPIPTPVQTAPVIEAEEAAMVAKATSTAKTDAQVAQLQQISSIDDGAERRKQLAAFLSNES